MDDSGATINTAATSGEWMQIFDVESGLSCQSFLGVPDWAGWELEPVRQWPVAELVLAYWFLEGEPGRLDIDADGVPCEELFQPGLVTDVMASAS